MSVLLSLLLLFCVWCLDRVEKTGQLDRIPSWKKRSAGSDKGGWRAMLLGVVFPWIKVVAMLIAGWMACPEWLAKYYQWLDVHLVFTGERHFPLSFGYGSGFGLLWLPIGLLAVNVGFDLVNGSGIKDSSYVKAFFLPILVSGTHGMVHDWVVAVPSAPDNWVIQVLDEFL